jgi:hypothetical protein
VKTILSILLSASSVSAIPFLQVDFSQNPDIWDIHLLMTAREIDPAATNYRFYMDGNYAGGVPGTWDAKAYGDLADGYSFVNPDFDPSHHLPAWFSVGVIHTTALTYVLDGQLETLQGASYTVILPIAKDPVPDSGSCAMLLAIGLIGMGLVKKT